MCLQLCGVCAQLLPGQQNQASCTDADFVCTVVEKLELYIDGAQVSDLPNANTWTAADAVRLPGSASLIAIKGETDGGVRGLLASGAFATTDGSWKCTNIFYNGWAGEDYDDSFWPAATVIGAHGDSPWGTISGISDDAQWIWTEKPLIGDASVKIVYCRKKRGIYLCI